MLIVVGAGFTVSEPVAGPLTAKFPCAAYEALKLFEPAAGLVIVNVATPLPFNGAVIGVPPFTASVAFPVGVPASELTVTCTVPFDGYVTAGALAMAVVVAAGFTVSVAAVGPPAAKPFCAA